MRDALEDLASLHPASRFGRLAHCRGADREGRSVRGRRHHEAEGGRSAGLIGELAATVAMFVVLFAVLAAIASVTIASPDAGQQAPAAISPPVETR